MMHTRAPAISPRMRRKRRTAVRRACAIFLLAHFLTTPGHGQEVPPAEPPPKELAELTLEELIQLKVGMVYAASGYWQDVARAPSHVSILTGEEIKLHGHRNLAEALRSVPGLSVLYDRNYSYLTLGGFNRGDYNSHVLVLVDGHRLNDSVQDSALLGNDFILDVDLIDRVEVVRGPGSAVYGNNAFFGVVNVITRTGRQFNCAEASVEAGSFDTYKGRFTVGHRYTNGVEFLVSGSYAHSEGPEKLFFKEYNAPASNNGIARYVDGEEWYNLFGALSWRDFTLEGGFNRREKEIPTGSYSTVFNSDRNRTTDARGFADLKFQRRLAGDTELVARAHYDHSVYDGDYLYENDPPSPPTVLNVDRFRGQSAGGEVQLSKTLWERHTFTVGAELRQHFRQDQRNDNVSPREKFLDDKRQSTHWGVHGQAELTLLTNLTFTAGLRYDHASTYGDSVDPRLALAYAPTPRSTIKFLYGTAFRAPNPSELYYHDGNLTTKANPRLRPETISTYQAVWLQRLPGDVQLGVSAFYYDTKDLISYSLDPADGLLQFVNVDRVEAHGAQIELERNWASGVRMRGSYTYEDARNTRAEESLTRASCHLAKLNLAVPILPEKIFAACEVQYYGAARTPTGGEASGYWLAHATLFSRQVVRGLEISAGVYNLFDRKYGHPAGSEHVQSVIPQDGRTFRVKLTYRF